jgi:acetyl-CoA carboxylase biotin carboxyl carrier protein
MNLKELRELIEFLKEQDIAEFELERGDVKVRVKRNLPGAGLVPEVHYSAGRTPVPPAPEAGPVFTGTPPPPATPSKTAAEPAPEELHKVHSPIVGTYYESPSPGAPPFVKPGDIVEVGQVLCIVEAMKLMNEIESDVAGEVVKMLVTNGQPIEYGQELFAIRPRT